MTRLAGSDTDGSPFIDASGGALIGVKIHAGWLVDAVQGLTANGPLPLRGSPYGPVHVVTWPAGETLVRITGKTGQTRAYNGTLRTYVARISFVTRSGRVYGPYGSGAGMSQLTDFDVAVPSGASATGFAGRSATFLHAIGLTYAP